MEAKRIAELPKKKKEDYDWTSFLKTKKGEMKLRPIQNEALTEAYRAKGLIGLIGCGHGKTLITLLLQRVLESERVLLLLPAALIQKTKEDITLYKEHFSFDDPKVMSYEKLSRKSGLKELTEFSPDLIICDEAHYLKDHSSTRTGRIGRYLINNKCKAAFVSGTLFSKSMMEVAHLSDWAFGKRSPLPRDVWTVKSLDRVLAGEGHPREYAEWKPLFPFGETPIKAVFHRLKTAQGFVLSGDSGVNSSIRIARRKVKFPQELTDAINRCFAEGLMSEILESPELGSSQHLWETASDFAVRALAQLTCGCIYYWDWPNGIPDTEWLNHRRNWNKSIRKILEEHLEGFDSKHLIESEFEMLPEQLQETHLETREEWLKVKDRPIPPQKTKWVNDYLVEDISSFLKTQKEPILIWVGLRALGERLSEKLSIPYYRNGEFDKDTAHTCIVSIKSHGTGKNLQAWSHNLIVHPIVSPAVWEQLMARTHRAGQTADTVHFTVYNHKIFGSSLYRARKMAKIVQESTGNPQRLWTGDFI